MLSKEDNERLTRVGTGTPVGDLLRRYWYPIAAAPELARHSTKFVKILGEELVLFKDRQGRLGLIEAHCAHRRANLVYGIPEEDGLRCPYHGWKYDRSGRCLDQPFEETIHPGKTFKDQIQLSHYAVEELGGLIFAYLGPPPVPLVPRWDLLVEENGWREIGHTVTACNWMQTVENILDPVHVEWLHGVFRNYAAGMTGKMEGRPKRIRHQKIAFNLADYGIIKKRLLEGETEDADDWTIGHWLVFPSTQKGPDMLRFRVPVDEAQTAQWYYSIHPLNEGETQTIDQIPIYEMPSPVLNRDGQPQFEMLDKEVDPQDNAIFASQGVLFDRTRERLGESDQGIVLYRHLLDHQMQAVAAGKDPMNVFRDPRRNVCLNLPTESREKFLTGRLGARLRYSERYKPLTDRGTPLP
jgi:5,5'-dehydrodivanillate O-demethylase oxygenase subunit